MFHSKGTDVLIERYRSFSELILKLFIRSSPERPGYSQGERNKKGRNNSFIFVVLDAKGMKATPIEEVYAVFKASSGITTDSRCVTPNVLFWALRGERFDGNSFARQALDKGAYAAVVDNPEVAASDERCIYVENTEIALGQLAAFHRKQFAIDVLLITGTNGKTTTKELCHAVLRTRYKVLATEGNLNNQIGLPLTLLKLNETHQVAIIEAGASHPGDIRYLTEIAAPTLGIITNIGRAHLEGFGSYEGVIRTKTELYDYLRLHDGRVFLNSSDPLLVAQAKGLTACRYALSPEADTLWGEAIPTGLFLELVWHWENSAYPLKTKLVGAYNLPNVMAAIALGLRKGIDPDQINQAIERYEPHNNRSELRAETERHNRLVIDAYNANPSSMKAALDSFFALSTAQPRVLILGDMLELGSKSEEEHAAVLEQLAGRKEAFTLYAVGSCFGALKKKYGKPFYFFDTTEMLREALQQHPITGSLVLIKGSHGIGLQTLLDVL